MNKIHYITLSIFVLNAVFLAYLLFIAEFTAYTYPLYMMLVTFSLYVNFTPFHESSHNLIGNGKYKYLNDIVGRGSSLIYSTSFPAWKFIHSYHHKNTNHEDDPDLFYSNFGDILKYGWFLDYNYNYFYLKKIKERPISEVIDMSLTQVFYGAVFAGMFYYGYGLQYLLRYWIPLRISLFMSSYLLDYYNHHKLPERDIKDRENLLKITHKISGVLEEDDYNWFTRIIMQNHCYHNVHHMYTNIPFYEYQKVWKEKKDELKDKTPIITIKEVHDKDN